MPMLHIFTARPCSLSMCPTKKRAVAWIRSFLEPVCGQRWLRGPALPTLGKRVSCNPAEMRKTWEEVEENPFWMWWRRISSQQSEKSVTIDKLDSLKEVTRSIRYVTIVFSFRKINQLMPFALILCQYIADITCGTFHATCPTVHGACLCC